MRVIEPALRRNSRSRKQCQEATKILDTHDLQIRIAPVGNGVTMPATMLSPSCAKKSSQRMTAARAVHELFSSCQLPSVEDPKAFLAAAIGVAAEFPAAVHQIAFDPVRGLPSHVRRPTLCDIRAALEAAYAPIARQLQRERSANEQRAQLAALAPASAHDKAKVQARLDEYLAGRVHRASSAAPARSGHRSDHGARALADLTARKQCSEPAAAELSPGADRDAESAAT